MPAHAGQRSPQRWMSDAGGNPAQRVNETLGDLGRRLVICSRPRELTTPRHIQMQIRRVDVLPAFANRPDPLTTLYPLPLLHQLLVQMRVTQEAAVFVLNHDRIAEALGQVDRIDHDAGAHRVNRRLMRIPAVDINAAMMPLVKGGISLVVEDIRVTERDGASRFPAV